MKQRLLTFSLSSFLLLFFASCQHYYLAKNVSPQTAKTKLDSLQNNGRYFVFHGSGEPVHMKDVGVVAEGSNLQFSAATLSAQHRLHLTKGRGGKLRYDKNDPSDSSVTQEVHVYAPSVVASPGNTVTLPLSQVQKIEVLEIDKIRTKNSKTLGVIGYTLGSVAVIVTVAGLIALSSWNWH